MRIFRASAKHDEIRAPRDERGAAAIIIAIALPLLILATALVVDIGYGYFGKQRLQDALDLAAITAARELDGTGDERARARAAAIRSLEDNGFSEASIQDMRFGRYRAGRPVGARFQVGAEDGASPNAVQIEGISSSPRFFSRMISDDDIPVDGVSTATAAGKYTVVRIGSGLASLKGGLLNTLLGTLLGGNVDLTLLDYNGLLDANIELLAFLDAYAIRLNLDAGDYDGLLSADASLLGIIGAVADVAHNAADGAQQAIGLGIGLGDAVPGLDKLMLLDLDSLNLTLGEVLDVGIGQAEAGLAVAVNVFDLITAGIFAASTVADQTGQHALGVSLGTFLGASLSVSVVEPPQPPAGFRVITEEDIRNGDNFLRTAQIRLLLRIDWQSPLGAVVGTVNGLLSILNLLGLQVQILPTTGPNANENLSVGLNLAYGEMRVNALGCEPEQAADRYVDVSIDTGALSGHIGQIDPDTFFSNDSAAVATPFRVVGITNNLLGLINPPLNILTLDLAVNLAVGAPTTHVDIEAGDPTDGDAFPDLAAVFDTPGHASDSSAFPSTYQVNTSQIISTLASRLAEALDLQATGLLGGLLQVVLDLVEFILQIVLSLVGALLDGLVDLLLNILGLEVGITKAAVIDLSCGGPKLVLP